METSETQRIDSKLIPLIDRAMKEIKDQFGTVKYRSRREVMDDAIKRFLLENGVCPTEEVPAS
jgi:hypothetical protein